MRFGSLFAGIGGFDLGLERAGMECTWQVERDPYAVQVLEKHWPDVRRHDDVCTFPTADGDWSVDLICGGFPCQDISVAGKGLGLAGERSGLWHEMRRIISEIRPRYVLVENVAAILARGMGTVLGELSEIGYDAEWHCVPASAVGAPHRRERIWIVAYANSLRKLQPQGSLKDKRGWSCDGSEKRNVAHANSVDDAMRRDRASVSSTLAGGRCNARGGECGCRAGCSEEPREGAGDVADANGKRSWWCRAQNNASTKGRRRRNEQRREEANGSGARWATEPAVGRVAYGIPSRVDRLRCLGNAVVPQVVELIGRAIIEFDEAMA